MKLPEYQPKKIGNYVGGIIQSPSDLIYNFTGRIKTDVLPILTFYKPLGYTVLHMNKAFVCHPGY